MKQIHELMVFGMIILLTTACEKYDEGGLVSKASKRLTENGWRLESYYRNGNDETSTVSTSDYNIIKLTKDELWYVYENGSDMHEFHLVPR